MVRTYRAVVTCSVGLLMGERPHPMCQDDAVVCVGISYSRRCAPGVHTATSGPLGAAVALLSCCGEAALAGSPESWPLQRCGAEVPGLLLPVCC